MKINYEGKVFRSVSNSETGDVSAETRFYYRQEKTHVWAEYSGGEIVRGFLIAKAAEDGSLEMRYQHINRKGELMTGKCFSKPEMLDGDKIRLHEKWQWTCGDFSSGESIVEEI